MRQLMMMVLAVLMLGGCETVQSKEFGETLTGAARSFNDSRQEKDEPRQRDQARSRPQRVTSNPGGNAEGISVGGGNVDDTTVGGGDVGGGGGGGGITIINGHEVINIQGETWIASGPKQKPGSGFWQNSQWYTRSNNYIRGREYVVGQPGGSGFWQYSKYWVPKHGGGGGGYESVINIQGETWVASGNQQTTQSGFWQNGQWYTRSQHWIQGTEYVVGNRNQPGGFWQYSKYWVRRR